jgi:hypothetical protein
MYKLAIAKLLHPIGHFVGHDVCVDVDFHENKMFVVCGLLFVVGNSIKNQGCIMLFVVFGLLFVVGSNSNQESNIQHQDSSIKIDFLLIHLTINNKPQTTKNNQ